MPAEYKRLREDYPDMVCVVNKRGEEDRECWFFSGDQSLQYAVDEAVARTKRGIPVYIAVHKPIWDSEMDKPLDGCYLYQIKKDSRLACVV